ncbi:hypothetical protein EJ08DRAFT_665969 [Tothia fuscella]|uniref:DUF6594 domain-containing protein n=1 Tax=Tothia fuscella TaxID=1048955 RepID=A0A9P4TST9_9PEZI|nr:hypothetical protein EJ08DRAFT_665969 [Tothia fuscella]
MLRHQKDTNPVESKESLREKKTLAAAEIATIDTRVLESCPNGYPRLAAFLSSESNFSLYRGFSFLHSRVLLELQAEIAALESELDELDEVDNETPAGKRRLRQREWDARTPRDEDGYRSRHEVLAQLRTKLVEYDELHIKARDLQAFQRPSERDYRSVRTWFWNLKPLVGNEAAFIKKKKDFVSLRVGRDWSGFDDIIESNLRRFDCSLMRRMFCTRELQEKTNDQHVYYYSASRVESFVDSIITSIIFVLLVLPVVAMYKLTSLGNSQATFNAIGVLVVFTLLFSVAMSMLTKARRHELFAASAAYCAVLVVFISNFSGSSLSDSGSGSMSH